MSNVIGAGEWFRMFGSLLLVFALMAAAWWAYRWLHQQTQSGFKKWSRKMVVRETISLGLRQRLMLVEVDDRQVMIGVSPSGVTLLSEWPLTKQTDAMSAQEER